MSIQFNSQQRGGREILLIPDFQSAFVRPRNIALCLPPGYRTTTERRYRVIYAHDGQNLFDPKTSYSGVDWGICEALDCLPTSGEVLVVGIWNTLDRYREYDPQRVVEEYLNPQEQSDYLSAFGRPLADRYLKFVVQELKPFIDSHYRTLPTRADTFLLGSSMGGMISTYALCEYPGLFGAAACLSTHWPAGNGNMVHYLADKLPDPQNHRFYFDFGTETIDARYEPFQRRVDQVLRRRGYTEGENWVTRKFCGEDHSERAWQKRVEIPLRFLLG